MLAHLDLLVVLGLLEVLGGHLVVEPLLTVHAVLLGDVERLVIKGLPEVAVAHTCDQELLLLVSIVELL